MKTLRETLQQQLEAPVATPQLGQTEEAARLIQAKSGKSLGSDQVPARSAQQELQAQNQTRVAGKQQALKGALAGQDIQQAQELGEQQEQEALKNVAQDRKAIDQDFNLKANSILANLSRQKEQLSTAEYQNRLEQAGFFTRLANQQYVQELTIEAQKARLNNDVRLKEELAQAAWEDERTLLGNQINFTVLQNANRRQFNEAMRIMDANVALRLAEADIDAFKTQQIWSGVAQGASAAASIYATPAAKTTPVAGASAANKNVLTTLGTEDGVLA